MDRTRIQIDRQGHRLTGQGHRWTGTGIGNRDTDRQAQVNRRTGTQTDRDTKGQRKGHK
jgi:hypothetical protein